MSRWILCGILSIVFGLNAGFALCGLKPGTASPSAEEKTGPPIVR